MLEWSSEFRNKDHFYRNLFQLILISEFTVSEIKIISTFRFCLPGKQAKTLTGFHILLWWHMMTYCKCLWWLHLLYLVANCQMSSGPHGPIFLVTLSIFLPLLTEQFWSCHICWNFDVRPANKMHGMKSWDIFGFSKWRLSRYINVPNLFKCNDYLTQLSNPVKLRIL